MIEKCIFVPKNEDDIKWWLSSDKFGQICWNWNAETKTLLKNGLDIIYFEKIIGDYDYFKKIELLDKIGLNMDFYTWKNIVSVKKIKPKLSFTDTCMLSLRASDLLRRDYQSMIIGQMIKKGI